MEEALRAEEGVVGVPENVDLANTIFARIDACAVFVPDISIITPKKAKRPSSNPNVLIEYGRATKSCGDSRIVPVFNTAFGDWETDRPFDMKHKIAPTTYHLAAKHDSDEKKHARDKLVKDLTAALKAIHDAGLFQDQTAVSDNDFIAVPPTAGSAIYFDASRPIFSYHEDRQRVHIHMRPGPKMYLRLQPTTKLDALSPEDGISLVNQGLEPMRRASGMLGFDRRRNKWGAVAFHRPEPDGTCLCLTQLHGNSEIWGIEAYSLVHDHQAEGYRPYIPNVALEQTFTYTLTNYLKFLRDVIKAVPPLRMECGLTDVEGYGITGSHNQVKGEVVDQNIIWETTIEDYETEPTTYLSRFFDTVWSKCGLSRPPTSP